MITEKGWHTAQPQGRCRCRRLSSPSAGQMAWIKRHADSFITLACSHYLNHIKTLSFTPPLTPVGELER